MGPPGNSRRQTAMVGGAPAGSGRAFRLDPFSLPVRFSAAFDGEAHDFFLDRERAVLRRPLRSGPSVTVAVPVAAYDAVPGRMEPLGLSGGLRVIVELMHRAPDLSLPLVVANEPEDVAADWRAWGRTLNLPLLVVTEDGRVKAPLAHLGALVIADQKPRRRYS